MGHISVDVTPETCSNDPNSALCYLPLRYLECTNHSAISSLKNSTTVAFYSCIIWHQNEAVDCNSLGANILLQSQVLIEIYER